MEVLFEYRGSRRQVSVADSESVTRVLSGELQRIGKPRARVFTANDDLPNSSQGPMPDIYLLQKWSAQWDCYVDVAHCSEVVDGDRLAVIAKPKPTSKFALLCCCVSANRSSYRVGKVGGSGKNKLPKTEEIQSLEYKFRADSAAGSEWETEQLKSAADSSNSRVLDEGEEFIRAKSGRASWKLIKNSTSSTSVAEDADIPTSEAEVPTSEAEQAAASEEEVMQHDAVNDRIHMDEEVGQQEEHEEIQDVERVEVSSVELKGSETEEENGASQSVLEDKSMQVKREAECEMEETEDVTNEPQERDEEVLVEGEGDFMPEGGETMPESGQEDTTECVEGKTGNAEAKETEVNGDDGTDLQLCKESEESELPMLAPDQHESEQLDC